MINAIQEQNKQIELYLVIGDKTSFPVTTARTLLRQDAMA